MSCEISKSDQLIHERAMAALKHHYAHGDSGPFNRLVSDMPKSNRKAALLLWIRRYTTTEWSDSNQAFSKRTSLSDQALEDAIATPFWILKETQTQRRHVSGNSFDPALFFERVINEINVNIESISASSIQNTIKELEQILSRK